MIRITLFLVLFVSISSCLYAQNVEILPACFNTDENDFGVRKIGDKIYVVSTDLPERNKLQTDKVENNSIYSDLYEVVNCKLQDAELMSRDHKKKSKFKFFFS